MEPVAIWSFSCQGGISRPAVTYGSVATAVSAARDLASVACLPVCPCLVTATAVSE